MPVLKEVVGRLEDVVVGPDGRRMVRFHGVFVDLPHIRQGQVVQEALDRIRVRVVPAPGYGDDDAQELERRVRQRLGHEVRVEVETVPSIPCDKSGKFRAVVNNMGGPRSSSSGQAPSAGDDRLGARGVPRDAV
jgi:phenylacetate-CoA ligase